MGVVGDQVMSACGMAAGGMAAGGMAAGGMAAGGKCAVANAGREPGASHTELLRQPMDRPLPSDLGRRADLLAHANASLRSPDLAHQLLGDGLLSCRTNPCGGEAVSDVLVGLSLLAERQDPLDEGSILAQLAGPLDRWGERERGEGSAHPHDPELTACRLRPGQDHAADEAAQQGLLVLGRQPPTPPQLRQLRQLRAQLSELSLHGRIQRRLRGLVRKPLGGLLGLSQRRPAPASAGKASSQRRSNSAATKRFSGSTA
jgi:hypothetical protein